MQSISMSNSKFFRHVGLVTCSECSLRALRMTERILRAKERPKSVLKETIESCKLEPNEQKNKEKYISHS